MADDPRDDPRLGAVLDGRYRVIEPLAAGGIGMVYRGERVKLGREVAIKFLHAWAAAEPTFVKRFELEALAMARLQHANCAAVIDTGVHEHEPYVVMELVGGEALIDLLDRGPVPAPRAIELVRQVLAALDHAHAQGVIHRDIKPSNIAVTTSTEFGDQVKVLDFGLAKLMESAGGLTGHFAVGTPTYMPPEQSRGDPVDARTDLYATGLVLFELLTGEPPFRGDEPTEVILAHQGTPPPLLSERRPEAGFSAALEAVVLRALAKAPDDRFASAAEMARALEAVPEATRPRAAPAPSVPPSAPSDPRPRPETIALASDAIIPVAAPPPPPAAEPVATPPPPPPLAAEPVATPPPPPPLAAAPPLLPAAPPPLPAAPPLAAAPLAPPPPRWLDRLPPFLRTTQGKAAVVIAASGLVIVIALVASAGGGDARTAAPPTPAPAATEEVEMPAASVSAEVARLRARARGADTGDDVVRALVRLGSAHPTDAEIPLLLGEIYCQRLWVNDCLDAFRRAIRIAPALRDDGRLLRAVMYGLGNDGHHARIRRFLVDDIGPAAVPYLEEVVAGRWRKEVKSRASATLAELRP
ncbi:MAG: serine/threonine protein kinase [Myxococcales bacterium]|nr:serine/threonine protein kinase [Myxococcales bacterium]